jgi:glucosamine-phosphate N-acetyltransferase
MSLVSGPTLKLAFPSDFISQTVRDAVGADFQVRRNVAQLLHAHCEQLRPLAADDYTRGHLNVLAVLTVCPDVGREAWKQRFDELALAPSTYFPLVIVRKADDKIVGCGTLVLERKFLRGLGLCGHIEDIAVAKDAQGKGFGKRIIEALTSVSEGQGAYKTILDCNKDNIRACYPCAARLVSD